jgi:ankyrin repeat protein
MEYYSDGLLLINLMRNRIKEKKSIFERKINLNTRDRFSRNALYWAITYQWVSDIKLLLAHGISQEVAPNLDALTHAINIGNPDIISIFKKVDEKIELSA